MAAAALLIDLAAIWQSPIEEGGQKSAARLKTIAGDELGMCVCVCARAQFYEANNVLMEGGS